MIVKIRFGISGIKKEIQRTSTDTEFNTKTLLNGDYETNGLKIQAGANAGQSIELFINGMGSEALGLKDASIATREEAEKAMSSMDEALKRVSNERSRLGAYQNRLEHAYNANVNTAENLQAAESRIRDADIAKEMMNMVKAQILMQASQYVLAMHMQQAQSILKLLEVGKNDEFQC